MKCFASVLVRYRSLDTWIYLGRYIQVDKSRWIKSTQIYPPRYIYLDISTQIFLPRQVEISRQIYLGRYIQVDISRQIYLGRFYPPRYIYLDISKYPGSCTALVINIFKGCLFNVMLIMAPEKKVRNLPPGYLLQFNS